MKPFWPFCPAKMLGRDIILHAVRKIKYRVPRDSKGEGITFIWESSDIYRQSPVKSPDIKNIIVVTLTFNSAQGVALTTRPC